jgi:hypothetical protein
MLRREHKRLPDIMSALGIDNPPTYPGDHFDLIWTVNVDDSTWTQSTQPANCTFPL